MTTTDLIRALRALYPGVPAYDIANFATLVNDEPVTVKQVRNALRATSSKPGPARSAACCPTCGAMPCHQRAAL